MSPRLARWCLAVTALAGAATFAWLAPIWLEPLPELGEILAALSTRNFKEGNRLVERYVRLRPDAPLVGLLYPFPVPGTAAAAPTGLEIRSPLGRVSGETIPIVFEDPRPEAAAVPFEARLEIEGSAPRELGPIAPGARRITTRTPSNLLGAGNGAGRVHVSGAGARATGAFEVADLSVQYELGIRQLVIGKIASGNAVVSRYLRAMCFARERCYCEALLHVDALLRELPDEPSLLAARAHLVERLRPFALASRR